MKNSIATRLMCAIGALLICCSALAAESSHKTRIVSGYVNLNDSANVYQALYDNTPIEPEFKLVPKFAIVGADNKFVFSIGASMKFTASFDWGNPVRNPLGMGPSDISLMLSPDKHLYQMSAGGSGIFFNIIGFPNTANEIGLFISVGLDNESNNTYKLAAGQIYMRYREFQCGYATSLYNDRRADAYTIDAHGPCASGAYNTVGVNWQHYFSSRVRMGVGVEIPTASYTQINPSYADEITSGLIQGATSHQYVPNFPFYVGYGWNGGHVRLSGIIRNVHYINLNTGDNHNVLGYGVKLTGNAELGPVNLFWMGQYGVASASCFRDDSNDGLDLVPDDATPGMLRPTQSWGCIAAAQWNITPKVFVTAQYSYLHNHIPQYNLPAATKFENQMHDGSTITANAVWKISSLFSTGLEYRYANRRDESGLKLANNRVYAMLMMTF